MYDGKTQLLIENPIDRYLINSPMLPELKKNADGSLTLYIQKDEPTDPVQKANWLPAPDGPIYMVMRLYWPKEAALNGSWVAAGDHARRVERTSRDRPRGVAKIYALPGFGNCAGRTPEPLRTAPAWRSGRFSSHWRRKID